jgi:hypothetical protein
MMCVSMQTPDGPEVSKLFGRIGNAPSLPEPELSPISSCALFLVTNVYNNQRTLMVYGRDPLAEPVNARAVAFLQRSARHFS